MMENRQSIEQNRDQESSSSSGWWPTSREMIQETKLLWRISGPVAVTGLLMYARAMISMLFLGHLGELELAGGSLAIGFANITGYSVISGLAMGMEPICSQAFGAKRWSLLGATLHRTIVLLLFTAIPIGLLWLNMERLLLLCGQDPQISKTAAIYIFYSLPDLIFQSFLHPLRIYQRSQNIAKPLAISTAGAVVLQVPISMIMLKLGMGLKGVALGSASANLHIVVSLAAYVAISGTYKQTKPGKGEILKPRVFAKLLRLSLPSCASVCLEWWWYELMIMLCGLLPNPKATIGAMGILIQITALLYILPSSLGVGVSTRVGNELGAQRPRHAHVATLVALVWAAVGGLLGLCFAMSVRCRWALLFTSDADIIKLTAVALPVLGLCELGNCPQTTGCGVLRGSARPRAGANINFGAFYLVGMPVAVLLAFFWQFGFIGLWMGLLSAQATCVILMLIHLFRTDWALETQKASQLTDTEKGEDGDGDGDGDGDKDEDADAHPRPHVHPENDREKAKHQWPSENSGMLDCPLLCDSV